MKLLLAACLTLACLAPATAEDFSYTSDDETALQQCIEAVNDTNTSAEPTDTVSMQDCIGAASGLCQQGVDGSSTIGMVDCNRREADWWDQYLNSAYEQLQSTLPHAAFDKLKLAQRAWLKYRDAKCAFVDEFWSGGSIRPVMSSSCLMDTTATRAIELAGALDGQ